MGTVTHEDIAQALTAALLKAQADSEDQEVDYSKGLTIPEIAEYLDVSPSLVRKRLRKAIPAGIIECNGRHKRRTMSNEWCRVPVYRVKTPPTNLAET